MARVFISYRRADSATFSGRIYDRLVVRYGRKSVFKDVDDIPPGADFAEYIQTSLHACAAALVVIGPRWLDARDEQGRRRLDNPADFVRLEIETAFTLGLTVIPLLVNGAHMPSAASLPESLHRLARANALTVRDDPDFTRDMERVIAGVEQAFAAWRAGKGLFGRRAPSAPRTVMPDVLASEPLNSTTPPHAPGTSEADDPLRLAHGALHEVAAIDRKPDGSRYAAREAGSVESAVFAHLSAVTSAEVAGESVPAAPTTPRPAPRGRRGLRFALLGLAAVLVVGSFAALFYSGALNHHTSVLSPALATRTAVARTTVQVAGTALAIASQTASAIAGFDATALPYDAPAPGPVCDGQYAKWQPVPPLIPSSPSTTFTCRGDHTHVSATGDGVGYIAYDLGYPLSLPKSFVVSIQTNNLQSDAAIGWSLSSTRSRILCQIGFFDYVTSGSAGCGTVEFAPFSVTNPAGPHTLALAFDGAHVTAKLDGAIVGTAPETVTLGDNWRVYVSVSFGSCDLSNFTIQAG